MGMSESLSKRRMGVVVNYTFLLLSLMLSIEGHWLGWSDVTIVGFCLSVVQVSCVFYVDSLPCQLPPDCRSM